MTDLELWRRYCKYLCTIPDLGLTIDVSRMTFDDAYLDRMEPAMQAAFAAMDALENGAIANPDENRMVGHYWLRAPELAPTPEITREIRDTLAGDQGVRGRRSRGQDQAADRRAVHARAVDRHRRLGARAEVRRRRPGQRRRDRMAVHFIDNTDPDGIARVLATLDRQAGGDAGAGHQQERRHAGDRATACSSSPPRTRRPGSNFAKHAVAVTGAGSHLDKQAEREGWLARFPMWDWVGGRTSETVGRSACCRRRCRGSTSTPCSPAPRPATRPRAVHDTRRTPPRCWP